MAIATKCGCNLNYLCDIRCAISALLSLFTLQIIVRSHNWPSIYLLFASCCHLARHIQMYVHKEKSESESSRINPTINENKLAKKTHKKKRLQRTSHRYNNHGDKKNESDKKIDLKKFVGVTYVLSTAKSLVTAPAIPVSVANVQWSFSLWLYLPSTPAALPFISNALPILSLHAFHPKTKWKSCGAKICLFSCCAAAGTLLFLFNIYDILIFRPIQSLLFYKCRPK